MNGKQSFARYDRVVKSHVAPRGLCTMGPLVVHVLLTRLPRKQSEFPAQEPKLPKTRGYYGDSAMGEKGNNCESPQGHFGESTSSSQMHEP